MNALKSLRSKINKTTRTYPLKKIYEVQCAAGYWDDSRSQKWGGQLLSGLPDFHFPSDHKRHRFTLGYVSHQIQTREALHWGLTFLGPSHTPWELELWAKEHGAHDHSELIHARAGSEQSGLEVASHLLYSWSSWLLSLPFLVLQPPL